MAAPNLSLFQEPAPTTVQTPSRSHLTANTAWENSIDDLLAPVAVAPGAAPVAPAADPSRPALVAEPAAFVLGGNAYFTLRSVKTGTRYTYRVSASKTDDGQRTDNPDVFFVSLLAGPDNDDWSSYRYMGIIGRDRRFRTTAKSQYKPDSTPVRAFAWTWERLSNGRSIDGVELWHEGKCGRCGRKLTVPESIDSGFGPDCLGKLEGGL